METKNSNSGFKSYLLLIFMIFQSFWLSAQEGGITKRLVASDEMNSLYIIGSVLVFGIIAYFVYSMIDKNRKADKPVNKRSVSHRSHNHRVIKKSA